MSAIIRAGLLVLCLLAFFLAALPARWLFGPGSRVADRMGRLFCRTVLALLRVRVVVSGTPLAAARAGLLVANHVSWIDPVAFGAVAPFSPLAKREVAGWPVIGAFARLQDTVLVDRSRRMQVGRVNAAMAERLGRGRSVLLFAEGTTHDGSRRGPFKTAHFGCLRDQLARSPHLAHATVQAAAIRYSDPAAAWVGEATLLPHLWTVLTRPGLTCTLLFGEATAVGRGTDRKALARSVQARTEELLESGAPPPPRPRGAGTPAPAATAQGTRRG